MDQRKPLSYESLKTVIQYMDANFRLVRSCQIASLRNIQKVVPMRLGVLKLDNSRFSVDNIDYRYKHCRKYTKNGGPVKALQLDYDLNNFGDEEIFHDLMPGDIVIKDRDWHGFPYRYTNFVYDSYVICKVRTGLNNQYLSRRSRYGMKLRDMMRKRLHEVFGGKRIHQVEHLKIGLYHGGLKTSKSMTVIDAILPILDVASFPLKSLSITLDDQQDPVIHSEILRSSELLNIKIEEYFGNSWANLLINLPNMKIHLKNQIPTSDVVIIVRNWMEQPRVIGTRLSLQTVSVREYFYKIKQAFTVRRGVLPETKYTKPFSCITLPMTSTSELNIYDSMSPNYKEELKLKVGQPYMVVMEVMPLGTAKHLKDRNVRKVPPQM